MRIINVGSFVKLISEAFSSRLKPKNFTNSLQLSESEISDLNVFSQYEWQNITSDILEKYFDVISYLNPEAYRYYIAGIMKLSVEENCADFIAVNTVIGALDRSPNITYWDDYFLERWSGFSVQEYEVIEEWVIYLASSHEKSFLDGALERSLDTLDLLKRNHRKLK